eukprot:896006-Prymnesium_polylepis.1
MLVARQDCWQELCPQHLQLYPSDEGHEAVPRVPGQEQPAPVRAPTERKLFLQPCPCRISSRIINLSFSAPLLPRCGAGLTPLGVKLPISVALSRTVKMVT